VPKVIDHDERRAYIMDVTLSLIRSGGFANASMRDIAAAAGFANGSLKHYFSSKDAIIKATWERELGKQSDFVTAAVQGKRGMAALRALTVTTLPLTPEGAVAGRVLLSFWDVSMANEALYNSYHQHLTSWRELICEFLSQGREDGEVLALRSNDEIADEIILLNIGAVMITQIGPETSPAKWHLRHLERLLDRLGHADG
jgi:AcrR family transcriptional regulator